MTNVKINTVKPASRILIALATAVTLSACVSPGYAPDEGIGYREKRFAEISAVRTFESCRNEALKLDRQAKADGSSARYLASARLLEKCEAEIGPNASMFPADDRIQAYALSIQNHFKGGDTAAAVTNLKKFKQAFPGKDLYFADGSSFIETMEVMLGLKDRFAVGEFSVANISRDVKAEMRRIRYWTKN